MKQKIAVFQADYGSFLTYAESMEKYTDCVRVTEYVEVDFPELSLETVVCNQVSAIDKKIEKIKSDAMNEVAGLQTRKAELLALTHEVAA